MSYLPELRASLVRAADRQHVALAAPRPRRWPPGAIGTLVAAGVAIAVMVGAVVLVGRAGTQGHPVTPALPSAPAPPSMPNASPAQWTLINDARKAAVARDRACSPFARLPAVSKGSPARALTSILGVLRGPATVADTAPLQLFERGLPYGGLYPGSIRLARSTDRFSLYIMPSANVTGWRPVPKRCLAEEAAALRSEVGPSARRQAALAAQRNYLIWQQYEARHAAGICLAEIDYPRRGRQFRSGSLACGSNVPQIEQGIAGLGGVDTPPGGNWFHGVVPDGVASVTLKLPHGPGTLTAKVVNNMFLTWLPNGINFPTGATIIWRTASGAVIRALRVP